MERLGRYQLTEVLGRGGMAVVHAGFAEGEAGFRKPVVIKRIHTHLTQRPEIVRMLVREARITVQLDHPNIVQVLELGRSGGEYFVALERVDGCDLQQLLAAAAEAGVQIQPALAAHVIREVLAALDHAHAARDADGEPLRVVHRDISPSNVLIGKDGRVRLTDFGIAASVAESTHGGLKGKLAYMSPEQARGQLVGPSSDLYSTALVLAEMLTGQRMLRGDDDMILLRAAQQGVLEERCDHLDAVPAELAAVLRQALAPQPWDRHRDAAEMRDALAPQAHELEQGRARLAELMALLSPGPAHVLVSGDLETATPPKAPVPTEPMETLVTRSGAQPTSGEVRSSATVRTLVLMAIAGLALALGPQVLRQLRPDADPVQPGREPSVSTQPGPREPSPPEETAIDESAAAHETSIPAAIPPEPATLAAPVAGAPGALSVIVLSATATVTVDTPGWQPKDTPFTKVDVPAGTWHVRVSNPHLDLDWSGQLDVGEGEDIRLSFVQDGDAWRETLTRRRQ